MELIGKAARRVLEDCERTAKARNEAPGRLEDRGEFLAVGLADFQISIVERTAAPTAYAGRNDEPQIVRQSHTPANEMLCRQHEPGRDDRFPRMPFPAVRAASNDNKRHDSLLYRRHTKAIGPMHSTGVLP